MVQIETLSHFDFRCEEYSHLFERSRATAFQHGIWLDNFYEFMPPMRGAKPLIVTFRDETGQLQGLVPMITRHKSGLRLIDFADLGVTDYAAPILDKNFEKTLLQSQEIGEQFRASLPVHDILRIRPVRSEYAHVWNALTGARDNELDFGSFASELGDDYETWRAQSLDKSLGKQMDRKRRKLEREHAMRLRRLEGEEEIVAAMTTLASLRHGRFEGDPIQEEHALAFYTQVAVQGAKEGIAETIALTTDEGDIGYVFGLTHEGRFYYLLIGCDYENWGKFSPGLLMYDGIIRDWMERGGNVFDFTIGGEDFKMKFNAKPTSMSVFLARGSLIGGVTKRVMPGKLMGVGGIGIGAGN